ncbi:mediator of RNA polymerase II transcription subunit 15a-like isoform X2 [Miscanthus floridulus]|uniref:mediator of RNA polymerase II transcription subunit 15a-like isoform X2 n=1 Tax=Miscanthus floridulus TaxID=154761 RepID=UPI00345AB48C
MDGAANWRPTQGADPAAVAAAGGVDPNAAAPAGSDWGTQLQPEARHRIVNKIMETLKKHLPVSIPEGLTELHKIAVRFEEKIYTAATNQSDYLRKISLKMLSMESQTKTQQNPGNAQVIPNQNPPGPGSSSKGKKQKKLRCHFCKKGGHFKKDCLKRKIWFEKKELLMIQPISGLKHMRIKMKALY